MSNTTTETIEEFLKIEAVSKLMIVLKNDKFSALNDNDSQTSTQDLSEYDPIKEIEKIASADAEVYEEKFSETQKDLFYQWHKARIYRETEVKKLIPTNVETHLIVTANGHVAIIRKPIGRVLGKVMSKVGAFTKDPDYYSAGSIIFNECRVFVEKPIENNADELFSVKMACLGATNLMESRIKKN